MDAQQRAALNGLIVTRNQIVQQLAEISSQILPDTSIDGQSSQWNAYRTGLLKDLKDINEQIQLMQSPFTIISRGKA